MRLVPMCRFWLVLNAWCVYIPSRVSSVYAIDGSIGMDGMERLCYVTLCYGEKLSNETQSIECIERSARQLHQSHLGNEMIENMSIYVGGARKTESQLESAFGALVM